MLNAARKIRVLLRAIAGQEVFAIRDISCRKVRFGSEYGGWEIATDYLPEGAVVYSFGVGEDISFELGLLEKFNVEVHAFDPTPRAIAWVRRHPQANRFAMHEYGLAAVDGFFPFAPPENPAHVSYTLCDRPPNEAGVITVPVKRLGTVLAELGHHHVDVLKMDIEGAEYEVIDDIYGYDIRPTQILVEFHHRFPNIGVERTRQAMSKLKSMGYCLFSVSPTNEEFCFVRSGG